MAAVLRLSVATESGRELSKLVENGCGDKELGRLRAPWTGMASLLIERSSFPDGIALNETKSNSVPNNLPVFWKPHRREKPRDR